MIIWGSYVMHKTLGTGEFYCPRCTDTRRYVHKRPRRWGHLYWIPIIPMETYPAHVECVRCSGKYVEEVIGRDPRKERQELIDSLSAMTGQVMIHVAAAQSREADIAGIEAAVKEVIGIDSGLSPEVESGLAAPLSREALLQQVKTNGGYLMPKAQESVLRLAIGQGRVTPEARTLLAEIGEAMGMTPAHVNGLLSEMA